MSQYSTSKMLGKLAAAQSKSKSGEVLKQKTEEVGEVFAVPQLKPSANPSEEPEMKEVLANILGPSSSKKYSPIDK